MREGKYSFQKLTPIKDVNLEIYEDALNFIFENDDIKNVAISGPYSAGKSSVIETYKNKYPEIRCLHISLSYFESVEAEIDNFDVQSPIQNSEIASATDYSSKPDEVILEGKILNQLIHQSDPDKIPQSNFKLKQRVSTKKTVLQTVLFISFLTVVA